MNISESSPTHVKISNNACLCQVQIILIGNLRELSYFQSTAMYSTLSCDVRCDGLLKVSTSHCKGFHYLKP